MNKKIRMLIYKYKKISFAILVKIKLINNNLIQLKVLIKMHKYFIVNLAHYKSWIKSKKKI